MDQKEINQDDNNNNNKSFESNETGKFYNKDTQKEEEEILKLFCPDIEKINEKDECNWTPLYRSVIAGNIKASEVLLNNGADPNIQCSMGETSLYQAVDMEKTDHVKLLLKHGADPNITQIDGLSSLHLAVSKQNILIIKYLLKFNANPNKQSSLYKQTPVHLAIKNNVESTILLILANSGGSLTLKDKFGKKPIDYINSEEMRKTVEMLKLEKNNENIKQKMKFFTPSKKNKLTISNVISKTIQSQSPKMKDFANKSNIISLKDSGKTTFNFIELKSGEQKVKENNDDKENVNNNNIKKNLFEEKEKEKGEKEEKEEKGENEIKEEKEKNDEKEKGRQKKKICYIYKKAKYNYRNENSEKGYNSNKSLNNTKINLNLYNNIQSPIKEESSSNISSTKFIKNDSGTIVSKKHRNNSCLTESNNNTDLKKSKFNNSQSDAHNRYIKKRSSDKISYFKCSSNEIIKYNTNIKINKTVENNHKVKRPIFTSLTNKNMDSRNIKSIFENDSNNKNTNLLTTNSGADTQTNYFTNLTTNSYKGFMERNSSFTKMNENNPNPNIDSKTYNKPQIGNSYNILKETKILSENPLFKSKLMRNKKKNKNFFNKKNSTLRHNPTNKTFSIINQEQTKQQQPVKFLNDFSNKENSSNNIKLSILSGSTNSSILGKNSFHGNSHNSSQCKSQSQSQSHSQSQSILTYCTYTKSDNNAFLHVIEKNITKKVYKKESLPIYKWLKEIDLLTYLPLFLKKKIFSFQKIIADLKSKKTIVTPNKIKKLGIETPGHIYRIFVKLELDAELIDKRIYDYLLYIKREEENGKDKDQQDEVEESINSVYDCNGCTGCCSVKQTCIKAQIEKPVIIENKIFVDLDKWLKNIDMIKYKKNFVKYGFDKIEFFILQMFSSFPLQEKIIEKELNIENNNDIDMFILQLNKDVKLISHKIKKKRSSSVEVEKSCMSKYLLYKQTEPRKRGTRASSNSNCLIF